MPIPPFNAQDLLPDNVHHATLDEFRLRCVDEFPGSVSRSLIFANFVRYRDALARLGLSLTQWIDGSFVDKRRLNPSDIDLVNFCDSEIYAGLSAHAREQAGLLLDNNPATKKEYQVHSFLVMKFPYDHYLSGKFEDQRRLFRRLFFQPLDYSARPRQPAPARGRKGIVQITLGDAKLYPLIDPSL